MRSIDWGRTDKVRPTFPRDRRVEIAHFYTQLQAELGQSREAMVRPAQRIVERGDEPESFAGLVQVLRFCGLLDESVAAHERATSLDASGGVRSNGRAAPAW